MQMIHSYCTFCLLAFVGFNWAEGFQLVEKPPISGLTVCLGAEAIFTATFTLDADEVPFRRRLLNASQTLLNNPDFIRPTEMYFNETRLVEKEIPLGNITVLTMVQETFQERRPKGNIPTAGVRTEDPTYRIEWINASNPYDASVRFTSTIAADSATTYMLSIMYATGDLFDGTGDLGSFKTNLTLLPLKFNFIEAPSGDLRLVLSNTAFRSGQHKNWTVQLFCTSLAFEGKPAATLSMKGPDNQTLATYSADAGKLKRIAANLDCDNALTGNYTCLVEPTGESSKCLPSGHSLLNGTSLYVDRNSLRMIMINKRTRLIQIKNQEQSIRIGRLSTTKRDDVAKPNDCKAVKQYSTMNGVYTLYPPGGKPFKAYCDQITEGGGWTVFQRRHSGRVDFNQNWHMYKNGFGDLKDEFWLGLEKVYRMTNLSRVKMELRVEVSNAWFSKEASYSGFSLTDEGDKYRLVYDAFVGGTAGDGLREKNPEAESLGQAFAEYSRNMQFSTSDSDRDLLPNRHCGLTSGSGWWFAGCYFSNLNNKYLLAQDEGGMAWSSWRDGAMLHTTEMKFRSQSP